MEEKFEQFPQLTDEQKQTVRCEAYIQIALGASLVKGIFSAIKTTPGVLNAGQAKNLSSEATQIPKTQNISTTTTTPAPAPPRVVARDPTNAINELGLNDIFTKYMNKGMNLDGVPNYVLNESGILTTSVRNVSNAPGNLRKMWMDGLDNFRKVIRIHELEGKGFMVFYGSNRTSRGITHNYAFFKTPTQAEEFLKTLKP